MNLKPDQDLTTDAEELKKSNVSKLFRHSGEFQWNHIDPAPYKTESGSWKDVSRRVFVGESGESSRFHVRYFEIAQGGHSTLEQHEHEHAVVIMRGQGHAIVGDKRLELGFGDVLYVSPNEVHQLSNSQAEPFGFMCMVNAERDRPRPVNPGAGSACE